MADSAELPGSAVAEPEFASEMEITVQSDSFHNYVLLAFGDNTVEDVLVKILGSERAGRVPEPRLYFKDLELEKQKTLADCGIEPDSVLYLTCTPRVLVQADDPTELDSMGNLNSGPAVRPNGNGEMKIFVLSKYFGNFALEVASSNTIQDVLITLPIEMLRSYPEPKLYFSGHLLETAKSLADYSIQDGSILHLEWTDWMSLQENGVASPTGLANMGGADSSSSMRPNGDGKIKIFVRSYFNNNYALEVDSSNTIQDVLVTVDLLEDIMETKVYFNGRLLERAQSLAHYGIEDGSILHLKGQYICNAVSYHFGRADTLERPNIIPARKRIAITGKPLAIWEMKHDKVLLNLFVEQISNGEWENMLHRGKDFWGNTVAKFNQSTGLKYEYRHLYNRFEFYECEYQIVNRIRHHPKFSWDHERQVVIATDADWNEYLEMDQYAKPYRRRAVPYFDLMEILFANTEAQCCNLSILNS